MSEFNCSKYKFKAYQNIYAFLAFEDGKSVGFDEVAEYISKLEKENEKLKEFVKDCSGSHVESRYKYRAQALLNEINRNTHSVNSKHKTS
jgi:hypothetical protein